MPRVVVATTVHHPDDTRILERLIRSLRPHFDITYVCREPGPTRAEGAGVVSVRGGRFVRWVRLWRHVCKPADVLILHDPELLLHGIIVGLFRRTRVVFDLHENLPAQITTKEWIPRWLRRPMALGSRVLLRVAERTMSVTLAESGYRDIFRKDHPVFPNHLADVDWIPPTEGDGSLVYVGDVTESRGLPEAVLAAGRLGRRLVVVGRCSREVQVRLSNLASRHGCDLELTGRLPWPEAMERASKASVGLSPLLDVPNYRYSLPTKTLEYLAVGVPVVASDLPGTRAVLEGEAGVFLVPPGDVDALVTAIEAAAEPEVRERTRLAAESVRARYRWPDAQVVEFYRRLAG